MHKKLEDILLKVQKPTRYVGGEFGSVMKNPKDVDIRYAFCFPDTYEIGMSHLGMKILYHMINERARRLLRTGFCAVGGHGGGNAKARHSPFRPGNQGRGEKF